MDQLKEVSCQADDASTIKAGLNTIKAQQHKARMSSAQAKALEAVADQRAKTNSQP